MDNIVQAMMGAAGQGGGLATDPNFNQTTLLLHGDGTNGAQNNTFLDSSSNTFTITRNGNTTQGTFSPFSLPNGEWSNYFDGSGDYLSFSSAVYDFGSSEDYSVEFFINFNSTSGSFGITGGYAATGTWTFNYQSGVLGIGKHFVANQLTVSQSFNIGQWYHVVACRESGTLSIFVDGTRVATTSDTTSYAATTGYIGFDGNTGWGSVNGYMSNVRVLTGGSANTASSTTLTVPASPLTAISGTELLTCQSNRFVDNSSNAFAITVNGNTSVQPFSPFLPAAAYSASVNGGSGYFGGTGDYIQTPTDAALSSTLLASNFTIQAWIYVKTLNNGMTI